ncbi:MAG: hypothetical protein SPE59_10785 [Treponema sp.]|nr:hypothetical protein [Treponema sp.]
MIKKVLFSIVVLCSILFTSCSFFLNGTGKVIISLPSEQSNAKNNRAAVEGADYIFYLTFTDSKGNEVTESGKSGEEFSIDLPAEEYTITGIGFLSEYEADITEKSSALTIEENFQKDFNFDYYMGTSKISVVKNRTAAAEITLKHQLGEGILIIGTVIPKFSVQSKSKSIQKNDSLKFVLQPEKGMKFYKGTTYKWFINNVEIDDCTSSEIEFLPEAYKDAKLGRNVITVQANYGDQLATSTADFVNYEPGMIYYKSNPYDWSAIGWESDYENLSYTEQVLTAFCYDEYRNLYVATVTEKETASKNILLTQIQKYTFTESGQYSKADSIELSDTPIYRMCANGDYIYYLQHQPFNTTSSDESYESKQLWYLNIKTSTPTPNYKTFDDYITAIACENNTLYVALSAIEKTSTAGVLFGDSLPQSINSTTELSSYKYYIKSYELSGDGSINFESAQILYEKTDDNIYSTMWKLPDLDSSDTEIYYDIEMNNIITDINIYNDSVYALQITYLSNLPYNSDGNLIDKYKTTEAKILTFTNNKKSEYSLSYSEFYPSRIIAIKPKELVFVTGADEQVVYTYNFDSNVCASKETVDYNFDCLVNGSGFEAKSHLYTIIKQIK